MGVVKGAISIKDNATAVLKSIRQEQTSFRKDVEKTKKELTRTWDKQYKAKIEATAAMKKAKELKSKLEPLRKKVVTVAAMKDIATDKIKKVENKVRTVGKMVAKPVVNVVVKGAQALSGIGKGIAGAAKIASVGIGAVGVAGAAALKAVFNGSEEDAKAAIEAETKLTAVLGNVKSIQAQGAGAVEKAKKNLTGVAGALQEVGVIEADTVVAGMQQLATFQLSDKEISTLSGGMADLLAQQKGLNATQGDAVGIANLIGKAMQGQVGALSKVGITFDDAQEKALKTGDAQQRAAVLAQILQENVGGVNKALAQTDQGKIQQVSNAYGDMKEEVGALVLSMKSRLASVVMKNIPTIQKLGTTMMGTISKFVDNALPVIDKVITNVTPAVEGVLSSIGDIADDLFPVVSNIFSGLSGGAQEVMPILKGVLNGFKPLIPQLISFGGSVFATIQQIVTAAMPAIGSIITTVQNVIPAVLPVLQTVITTIGSVISQAAPVIAGLVAGIGTVITTLAPIFNTIFTQIGEKVGSVIGFVSERMGFIQNVIGTVAPLLGDILSTAWSVISPVMDIAISVFKILFSVVQRVFPGIQKVMETVWGIIKPIVEGVGKVVGKIAGAFGWIADKISGGGGEVGANAKGDNNWKGGLTWVGEKGAELVDLPKGSRILPNKESVSFAQNAAAPVVKEIVKTTATKEVIHTKEAAPVQAVTVQKSEPGGNVITPLLNIEKYVGVIANVFSRRQPAAENAGTSFPAKVMQQFTRKSEVIAIPENANSQKSAAASKLARAVTLTIAKLADTIIVREEADIEKITNSVAKKVIEVALNMP